tara:strand:- start:58 stop:444 length:387 start_codon:yes stop_codon:yes gene_type:complete
MEKYFYFRKDATTANDDDQVNGSNLVKVSDLISMEATGNTSLVLRFHPRMNAFAAGGNAAADADNLTDTLTLTVGTNAQRTVIETICAAIAKPMIAGAPNLIVLFDANSKDGLDGITDVVTAVAAAQA